MLGTVGGLHKSIDGGKNWALLEGINNITGPCKAEIGCLPPVFAIETSRTNPQLVYAGSLFGKGIFKSDDGGVNWSITNLALSYPSNLKLDGSDPNFLVVGHLHWRILKTNDGGEKIGFIRTLILNLLKLNKYQIVLTLIQKINWKDILQVQTDCTKLQMVAILGLD